MLWLNLLILVIVLTGLVLFANGIIYSKNLQIYFCSLLVIIPIFWLAFGLELIIMTALFAFSIFQIVKATQTKKQIENDN